ncbi:MAG TPA: hypothetical protein VMM16_14530 [Verrucomicrobiae bacterium]|nr:hypothetical protein [Verrucomicrobiae bacterium]
MGHGAKLRRGDLVEVRPPEEILRTLDSAGTSDQLPLMREMAEFCGKRFRVARTVVKVCASGMKGGSVLRGFRTEDVVILDDLRCSGADHDGCQKACAIFWRDAWLRKVEEGTPQTEVPRSDIDALRARLKTKATPDIYFCQASEILRATRALSRVERYTRWIDELRAGNCSVLEMTRRFVIFLYWKARRTFLGLYARGENGPTPTEALHLQANDVVQVKSIGEIRETLDDQASNRGLWFSPNMRLLCGRSQRVERRIDKLIVDGSGEMRKLQNTVFLEGSRCGCAHIAFGGCSRDEYVYWREIWLRRTKASSQ